ncbi:MAG: hypothetical protein J5856_09820 [Lachnospiraceae bacterium]|nr:hypothetical protein [Lachnospiraceae bacterium]
MERFSVFKSNKENRGTTLVEMVVSFTLLAIFVSASVVIISNVTTLYYRVRGESYARQVGDVVATKIASEISNSKYSDKDSSSNPLIVGETTFSEDSSLIAGNSLMLYNITDTKIRIFASKDEGILKIYYYPVTIEGDTDAQTKINPASYWTFDKSIYNGYEIEELCFVQADKPENETAAARFGAGDTSCSDYPANVIAVYMTLKSDRYGRFNICRYVKLYSAPDSGWDMVR